jgi:hypothetical protein
VGRGGGQGRRSDTSPSLSAPARVVLAAVICTRPAAVVLAAHSRSCRGTAAMSPSDSWSCRHHSTVPVARSVTDAVAPCAGTSILAAMAAMYPSPPRARPTRTICLSLCFPVPLKAEERLILDAIRPSVGGGAGSILVLGCRFCSDEEGKGTSKWVPRRIKNFYI